MSLLDDIEKELGEITPFSNDAKFIAAAPERIKLLVDFARASLTLYEELVNGGRPFHVRLADQISGLDLSDDPYQTEAERNFIAARKALKLED